MIADSHCHLDYPQLYNQLDEVIKRADNNEIKYMLSICTTLKSFEIIKLIIKKYKNIYGTFGIHPHETEKNTDIDNRYILTSVRKNLKIVGIGETGLDYYYNHSDKKIQKKSFAEHISAASQLDKPVIVHSRNAESDTFDILKNENKNKKLKVLMHCFTGSQDFLKKLLDQDFYFSVSGIITFKKSDDLNNTISLIPLEKLLVETDSPYLAPSPYRGKYNEPSYIVHTIDKLSNIKNLSKESVIKATTNNFLNLFNLNQ